MAARELTAATFDQVIGETSLPVLVDFWASWCGPCKMLSPIVDQVATQVEGKALVCKVNVDEEQQLAARFGIMSIPTLLVFKNGELAGQNVGLTSAENILRMLGL